jgi:hypothetical protein
MLISDFQACKTVRSPFLLFKPHSLQKDVIAAYAEEESRNGAVSWDLNDNGKEKRKNHFRTTTKSKKLKEDKGNSSA